MTELWSAYDRRTGRRATISTYFTKVQVEAQIAQWVQRDRKGKRPDVHDLIPHLEPRRVIEGDWP